MKKLNAIIIAMALVLSLGQCKKQETPATPNANDGMVYITVNVDNGGGRHHIEPSVGAYAFTNGDILYVGNNGHFVGTLTYDNGAFSGGIQSPSTDDYLHFYFLGGKAPETAPEMGITGQMSINIANQTDKLPIISYAPSTTKYTTAEASYSCMLKNKCGLVKFATNVTSKTVNVAGMNTVANINFETGQITSGTPGIISFSTDDNGEGWAILLEQNAADDVAVTAVGCEDGTCSVPTITPNMYYSEGINVNLTAYELLTSGYKGDVFYELYSDYTLYLSGTGNVHEDAFNWYFFGYAPSVKKIIFDKACTISRIDFLAFHTTSYAQLTDVEINTTVPLEIVASAFEYEKGGDVPVNFTITAPSITFTKHGSSTTPFYDYGRGPLNIVFNMEPITFEKSTFRSLSSSDAVTIPAGCLYHTVSYQFTDEMVQMEYEMETNMFGGGDDSWFWQNHGNLVEGVDYIMNESFIEITSSNTNEVFGSATVTIVP